MKTMADRIFTKNIFLLLVLFFAFCLPIILSITRIESEETRQFSIYNTGWDGTSLLREDLENSGFEVTPIVSTLNTLTRTNEMGVLVINGPSIFFDPSEVIALSYFIMRGGSVLLADDFGSANNILSMINTFITPFLGEINTQGFPIRGIKINQSLLMDSQSFHRSPVMPVLRTFYSGPSFPSFYGVSEVVTSYPSAITFLVTNPETNRTRWVPTFSFEGINIPGGIMVSTNKSWLEKDVTKAEQGDYFPDDDEWGNVPFSVLLPIPLGSEGFGNILLCSDPSIFINELLTMNQYDNLQFARNVISWLDYQNTGRIYYDESHLANAAGKSVASVIDPVSYIRLYLRTIDSLTMFPLLAPFIPLILFFVLRANYPKSDGSSPLLITKIKQGRSRSYFAKKMSLYMNYKKFDQALHLIYRRLKRQLHRKFVFKKDAIEADEIISLLQEKYSERFNIEEVTESLERIEFVIRKNKKISEKEFTQLVRELKNIEQIVTTTI
jgi:hypothetical protein